jgi:single-stranded-DNA-specific exonuclease RecJ
VQRFIPRTSMAFPSTPLLGLPMWFSKLLYMRGIDSDEKAQRFLYPSLEDLYDPFLMRGMDKAVLLIQDALKNNLSIVIYGDYDVDGICASAIMVKALRSLGATVCAYLPDRHEEGYGLNENAIRMLAKAHGLLITVDCGITNHSEVALAQALGMTVVVTDHHEPADTPSPADAILNPLLGYPFPRLCGAGVAFKLCQALLGLESVLPLLPYCALATVADIVPLADENRALVSIGLSAMDELKIIGLRALIEASETIPPITATHLAFRLAPRLNAAGRMSDAKKGLDLLLCEDADAANTMALDLCRENDKRRAVQEEMTQECLKLIQTQVDFKRDKAIVLVGDDFNPGIIGLCAGRLSEKFHYPTIVLSRREDGLLVGSARSIMGVNIHAALTCCKDLFLRFGGHAQAAGLTMEEEFLPELRRRLSLAIAEISDPACYIEQKEYDLALPLYETTPEMIDMLVALEPTGCGNPAPVFLLADGHVQSVRAMGREGAHLKLSLLDGQTLRDAVFFSMGALAPKPLNRVCSLYTPKLNQWQGKTSVQLQLSALMPYTAAADLPDAEAFNMAFLKDFCRITENDIKLPLLSVLPYDKKTEKLLFQGVQGTLVIARTKETAAEYDLETAYEETLDPRAFNTLLICPDLSRLKDDFTHILLADGQLNPQEAALIQRKCPSADLYAPKKRSAALSKLLSEFLLSDDELREIYKALRGFSGNLETLCQKTGFSPLQIIFALEGFKQLSLVSFEVSPFKAALLAPKKCSLDESPLFLNLRSIAKFKKEDVL